MKCIFKFVGRGNILLVGRRAPRRPAAAPAWGGGWGEAHHPRRTTTTTTGRRFGRGGEMISIRPRHKYFNYITSMRSHDRDKKMKNENKKKNQKWKFVSTSMVLLRSMYWYNYTFFNIVAGRRRRGEGRSNR